jgi:3-oxoacyl-[acyl-carrier-protein] synthase-1
VTSARPYLPITGYSVVSPFGNTPSALLAGLRTRRDGFTRNHPFVEFTNSPLAAINHAPFASFGEGLGEADSPLARVVLYLLREVLADSDLLARYAPHEIGLYFGTTTAGIEQSLEPIGRALQGPAPQDLTRHLTRFHQHGSIESVVRRHTRIQGPHLTFATACSSAAVAIMEAAEAVRSGVVKACIAGGCDVLCATTVLGFDSLQLLSSTGCTPFLKESTGITLAEGGGFLVLERLPDSGFSTPRVRGWLAGAGASSDAHHITQPQPDGRGMSLAMEAALADAALTADDIDYINAHGTGTLLNDAAEAKAIATTFPNGVPFGSTKALHGHALGGSGGIESVVSLLALQENTAWNALESSGDAREGCCSGVARAGKIQYVLSNSFGFGGSNASLLFSGSQREGLR